MKVGYTIYRNGKEWYMMKNLRRKSAFILALSLLMVTFVSYAVNMDKEPIEPIKEPVEEEKLIFEYSSFRGTVKEIYSGDGYYSMLVENDAEEEPYDKMVFTLSEDVILVNGKTMDFAEKDEIEEGMKVWIYYHKDTPILESYPARAKCDVVAIMEGEEIPSVEVYKFDENLVSTDGVLKIYIDDKTEIVDTEGNTLTEDDIKNRHAVVFYNIAALSFPAQTSPEKVIVFASDEITQMDKVVINGEKTELNSLMYMKDNTLMVPLRQVAEALGYEVLWNGENNSIEVMKDLYMFALKIGENAYKIGGEPVLLGVSPELKDSTTYVPLDFIRFLGLDMGITWDGILKISQ